MSKSELQKSENEDLHNIKKSENVTHSQIPGSLEKKQHLE